jgi:hypothetical protein
MVVSFTPLLSTTQPFTTLLVSTLTMLRSTSIRTEPSLDIPKLKKLRLPTPRSSWKRNATSWYQLLLRNQFIGATLPSFNARQLLKVPTALLLSLVRKSLPREASSAAQTSL